MTDEHQRETVRFSSGDDGDRCEAWVYLPARGHDDGPLPVVVMGHGLGAVRTMRLDAYAERFARAGYACVAFDHRNFGGSDGMPRQVLDIARQREDWRSALAWVRADPRFDPTRIAAWGTSFGGGHVLEIAAADHDLAAAVVQCPFTDGRASGANGVSRATVAIAVLAVRDRLAAWRGRPPVYVPTVGAPGSVALMSTPDAESGYLGLVPDGAAGGFENRVAARFVLQVLGDRPGLRADRIRCPILFAVCDHDSVAPASAALAAAQRAPHAELRRYPVGHFDIYVGEPFERAVADMVAFFDRHLAVPAEGPR